MGGILSHKRKLHCTSSKRHVMGVKWQHTKLNHTDAINKNSAGAVKNKNKKKERGTPATCQSASKMAPNWVRLID